MNGDLERTLEELGPEYRAVVARLRSSREVEPGRFGLKGFAPGHAGSSSRATWRRAGYLVAASIVVVASHTRAPGCTPSPMRRQKRPLR